MKRRTLVLMMSILAISLFAKEYQVQSPDQSIVITVQTNDQLTYSVIKDGKMVLEPSAIGMTLKSTKIGQNPTVTKEKTQEIKNKFHPVVQEKRVEVLDYCNQLMLNFKGNAGVIFRAYNDGAAYRIFTSMKKKITVVHETVEYNFPGSPEVIMPLETSLFTSQEKNYQVLKLSEVKDQFSYLPMIATLESGQRIAITEVHLEDYAGLFLQGNPVKANQLVGKFPKASKKERQSRDRHLHVDEREDYIAVTQGKRKFPWRLMVLPDADKELIESDIVWRLAPKCRIKDTSWIKPGKVAWDWWNANNVFGVDFKAGINLKTYQHYIDFASKHGIEYVILDEGWSDPSDLFKLNPDMDMETLFAYAKEKNVGIIPWVVWLTLDRQMDEALAMFEKLGAAGIKVDFMDRDDQKIVNWYWTVAEKTAKHHLLVDFHGAYKPTGLRRAYPNVITREGIQGMEYIKWSEGVTPEHDVTIPFTRMLAGPMDFTPGATQNMNEEDFHPVFARPMSMGTRCHQMAMFVVYESPLQMICDSPSRYEKEEDMMAFLGPVPSVWDETVVLDAKVGDYVIVARQSGNEWWVGAMTDWTGRELEIPLSFLGKASYKADIFTDGINAEAYGNDYKRCQKEVKADDTLKVKLAKGGGAALRLVPLP